MHDQHSIHLASSSYVGPCPLGEGLFARQLIRQAGMILRFTGPVVRSPEARVKAKDSFNLLQIRSGEYIDLESPGVFVNHSCTPNAGVVDDTVLIALRDIAPGEEITFDYSTTMSEQFESMQCLCGLPNCRQVIGDFHDLPRALKDRYLAARLVQRFIVAEHRERQRGDRTAVERITLPRATNSCESAGGADLRERRCA